MANMRPFIIAIAFGIIAVVLGYLYIQKVQTDASTKEIEMARVVRATCNIPPRTNIKEHMIEEIEVLAENVTPDTITELEEILGQVSVIAIYEHQTLLDFMFKEETSLEDLSRMLKEGERAVTIGVTEVSGLGGNLMPGDHVDVLVTILSNDEVGVPSTFTVLRDVDVMAVGQNIGFSEEENGAGISKSVTIKVDPFQSELLALASEVGSIRLALRDPNDTFAPVTDGTPLTDFVTYTPTREDLEEAAQRARQESEEAAQREHDRMMALILAQSESGGTINFEEFGPDINELPPPGPPPILIEVIMGGQSEVVEVPRLEEN